MAAENAGLRAERDDLAADNQALTTKVERLDARIKKLQAAEEARRAAKRQAAPFSRGKPKAAGKAKRPGRRPGKDYGRRGRRRAPEVPDEERQAPLPDACPHCGDQVVLDHWAEQFQDELVAAVVRRRYWVALGRCSGCHQPVHGRHPDQTSDALGAAG